MVGLYSRKSHTIYTNDKRECLKHSLGRHPIIEKGEVNHIFSEWSEIGVIMSNQDSRLNPQEAVKTFIETPVNFFNH
jgi:hypothetical protein